MTKAAGDYSKFRAYGPRRESMTFAARITIGATGAPTVATGSDPGITISRTGTGTYDLVYPAFPTNANVRIAAGIQKSAAKTVVDAVNTAESPTAGTATFKTLNASGTDTDPANGDILTVEITGSCSING